MLRIVERLYPLSVVNQSLPTGTALKPVASTVGPKATAQAKTTFETNEEG
jgi:hypothetical protein